MSTVENVQISAKYPCFVLNAAAWYKRKDFADYIITCSKDRHGTSRIPTFHCGDSVGDFSDVFVIFDRGSLSEEFPDDISSVLRNIADYKGVDTCVFWIKNF